MITSFPRSGSLELLSYINDAHEYAFNEPIEYKLEYSRFEATRFRRPLPQGWFTITNAPFQTLLDRGFDKVLYISRDLIELIKAVATSHRFPQRNVFNPTINDFITLFLEDSKFFRDIEREWKKREEESTLIKDPRFLKITLEDWNNYTRQTYNKILDFFEFPKEPRPRIIPVKPNRDFEKYSYSFEEKGDKTDNFIELMREHAH